MVETCKSVAISIRAAIDVTRSAQVKMKKSDKNGHMMIVRLFVSQSK